jgi:hypothetical protein
MEHDDSLLREIHRLTKENNTMLHRLERSTKRARFWKNLRLAVIIALLFGAYYFIQPFIENLTNAYASIQESFAELQKTKDSLSNIGDRF